MGNTAYTFPTATGSDNQILQLNASNELEFKNASELGTFLPLAGGTMLGGIEMSGFTINQLNLNTVGSINQFGSSTVTFGKAADGSAGYSFPTAAGSATEVLRMNAGGTGLEFVAPSSIGTFLPLAGGTMTGDIDITTGSGLKLLGGSHTNFSVTTASMQITAEANAGSGYIDFNIGGVSPSVDRKFTMRINGQLEPIDVQTDSNAGINYSSGTTLYGIFREAGAFTAPFISLMISFFTGIKYIVSSPYNKHRFYSDGVGTTPILTIEDSGELVSTFSPMCVAMGRYTFSGGAVQTAFQRNVRCTRTDTGTVGLAFTDADGDDEDRPNANYVINIRLSSLDTGGVSITNRTESGFGAILYTGQHVPTDAAFEFSVFQ